MRLEPQTLLAGRYRINDVIGQGGMGVVYRARDERLDRLVAIKTVSHDDPDLLVRLRREARLLARLTHPNVVSLYDIGDHAGQPYLVTQLVDGLALRGLLGRMSPRRVAWVAEQIAHGLAAAHAVGIVHRDLKPSNVLVGDGIVRLLDFGIAHHVDDAVVSDVGSIMGTAAYISPEQLRGQPAGPAADIYALGLVLVECFSGRAAFAGSFDETVSARLVERPQLPASMPEPWHGLVEAMADPEPGQRPPATVVASAMRALARICSTAAGADVADADRSAGGQSDAPAFAWSPPARSQPAAALAWAEPGGGLRFPAASTAHLPGLLRRPALVVPIAASAGFVLVVTLATVLSAGEPAESEVPIATQTAADVPVGTLPVTEHPPVVTVPGQLPIAEVMAAPETAAPPPTAAPTTSPPAPPLPPPTALSTVTTENRWERWSSYWRDRRARRWR